MSGQRRRRSRGRRRAADVPGNRYLRLCLPDGSHGPQVPVVFYPRYSTLVVDPTSQDLSAPLFDVSQYRVAKLRRAGGATFKLEVTDDTDRGWDGRPLKRGRRAKPRRGHRRTKGHAPSARHSGRRRRAKGDS